MCRWRHHKTTKTGRHIGKPCNIYQNLDCFAIDSFFTNFVLAKRRIRLLSKWINRWISNENIAIFHEIFMQFVQYDLVHVINMNCWQIICKNYTFIRNFCGIGELLNLHVFNMRCWVLCTRIGYVSSTNFTAIHIEYCILPIDFLGFCTFFVSYASIERTIMWYAIEMSDLCDRISSMRHMTKCINQMPNTSVRKTARSQFIRYFHIVPAHNHTRKLIALLIALCKKVNCPII